jgi:hypothetical protein
MTREEILALPPRTDLRTLGRALGLSEPTVRDCRRRGELERAGIKVVPFGAKYVVVTESLLEFLGIRPAVGASSEASGRSAPGRARPIGEGVRQARRLRAAGSGDGAP